MRPSKTVFVILLVLCIGGCLAQGYVVAGVAQARGMYTGGNNTNIGTNPYADMNTNADSNYATVNPNYSNRTTVYQGENGSVATNPGNAYAGQNGMATYNGYNTVVTGGYYNDYNSWSAGSAVANMPIPIGTVLEYAPSSAMPTMVGSTRYYYDNSNNVWYSEVFDGGAVEYQVVEAPMGAVVTVLPSGCVPQYFNGKSYSLCGNIYYVQVAGGYQVVALN
jgi:Family of unknown function (DUF6515)